MANINSREVYADYLIETGERFEPAYECGEIPPVFKRVSISTLTIPLTTIQTLLKVLFFHKLTKIMCQ